MMGKRKERQDGMLRKKGWEEGWQKAEKEKG